MLLCMKENMDIYSLFADLGGEPPKTKSERKKERSAAVNADADGNIDLDKDIEDVSASVQDGKPKTKKAKSTHKGEDTQVEAPVTCIGDNFRVTLEDVHSVGDCVNELVRLGYKEILIMPVCSLVGKNTLFFKQTKVGVPENRRIDLPVIICAGENRMELTADDFPDLDPDEISAEIVMEKWIANNPAYEGCGLVYEPKCAVAAPTMPDKKLDKKKEYELPMKITLFGEVITVTNEDLGIIGKTKAEAVQDYICSKYSLNMDDTELLLMDNGEIFFAEYNCKAKKKDIYFDTKAFYVNENASLSEVSEKYALPFTLYMANFNYSIKLTSNEFGGRNKVGREDVLKIAAKYCPTLQSSDRKADILYLREKNIVSVAAISGKKGL